MCTILLAFRCHPEVDLLVAANRDEFYARPSAPPGVLRRAPTVLGGRDLQAGGTWLGLNEHGLVVGLTNLRSRRSQARSRGQLVLDALAQPSLDAIEALARNAAASGEYRPGNLLFGNVDELRVAELRDPEELRPGSPSHLRIRQLAPGSHVVPSGGDVDDVRLFKVQRGLEALAELGQPALPSLPERLRSVLAAHERPPLDAPPTPDADAHPLGPELESAIQARCVHTPNYGTRSSTLLLLGPDLCQYHHCDAAPCVRAYRLLVTARSAAELAHCESA